MDRPITYRGRGAAGNPHIRFEECRREAVDDGWGDEHGPEPPQTVLIADSARSIITRNDSPDVCFDRSINPYRGCEHGCIYCYARPSHAWLGFSPGLDFESRLIYKPQAPRLLRVELSRPGYRCKPVAVGTNTDAYQPVERTLRLTRGVLEVLRSFRHPVGLITKSSLIERDIDLLADMAKDNLAQVAVSIGLLDRGLARRLEPRAAAPQRRLEILSRLHEAGIPVGVLVAPVIPALTDEALEAVLEREAGASFARYALLRLPREVDGLFVQWLGLHAPQRAEHVMARVRDCHGGRDYDPRYGVRMRGQGVFADLIRQRFERAVRRLGYGAPPSLDTTTFRRDPAQLPLL